MDAILYDLRGLKCPLPVIRTRKKLTAMPSGALILVDTSDMQLEDVIAALESLCRDRLHQLSKDSSADPIADQRAEKRSDRTVELAESSLEESKA